MSAHCLVALLGREDSETDGEHIRIQTGALILAEALHELTNIRRLLTPPKD